MRLPLVPTLIAGIAVPSMLALGAWQLDRRAWKAEVLADLAARRDLPAVTLDLTRLPPTDLALRRARVDCRFAPERSERSGVSRAGRAGYSQFADCRAPSGGGAALLVDIGWAARSGVVARPRDGWVTGRIVARPAEARAGRFGHVLIAETATPPLSPSAPPTLDSISDNHLSYALQWFSFAITLAVIYAIHVARWRRATVAARQGPVLS